MLSQRLKRLLLAAVAIAMLPPGAALGRDEMQNNDPDKYYIVLNTANQVVTVYQKDDDGEYTRIVRRFPCTSGKTKPKGSDPASPTPSGTWKIGGRERFGKFAAFNNEYARYWTQIVGGVYFHSIMFSSRDVSTLKKFAFNDLGNTGSHGCVRLYVEDAKWIYYNAPFGTTVKVTSGKADGAASLLKTDMSFEEYRDFQANIYDDEPQEDRKAWVSVDGAQLRTGNGTNDKLIRKLNKDDELTVLQEGDPWVKVVTENGTEGYVRRCFLTYEKGVMQSIPDGYYVASTQYLYAEPNAESEKLYKVARHSTITLLEEGLGDDGKWAKVSYWGTEGYMLRKVIKTGWATVYDSGAAAEAAE